VIEQRDRRKIPPYVQVLIFIYFYIPVIGTPSMRNENPPLNQTTTVPYLQEKIAAALRQYHTNNKLEAHNNITINKRMAHSGGIETTEQHDSSSDEESNIPPRSSGQPIGEEEEGRTAAQNPTRGSATLPPPPLPMAPESIIAIGVMEDETPPLPLVFSIDNNDTLLSKENSSDGPLITQQLSDDDEMARNDNARPSLPEEVITGVEEKPPLPLALTYDDSALGTKEKLDIQKETTPMPMVDDSSHHSQQQDDDQHTSTLINPQSIPFYEVEACLVRDSEIYDSDRRRGNS
jgi:hypothetical protein